MPKAKSSDTTPPVEIDVSSSPSEAAVQPAPAEGNAVLSPVLAALSKQAPAESTADDKNDLVSVFNMNPRGGDFVHHVYEDVVNEDGKIITRKPKVEWRVSGRSFANVPRWIADLWKRQAPGVVIDGASATKNAPQPVQNDELTKAALAENAELKTRMQNLEKMISELKANAKG